MVFISRLATAALLFTSLLVNSAPVLDPTSIGESLIHKRDDLSKSIITKCTVPGTLALTFDDGPYKFTEELLNTLKANNAKATFFVNGDNYAQIQNPIYSKLIQRAKNEGHQIASHTWDHKDLAELNNKDKILDEMNRRKSWQESYKLYKDLAKGKAGPIVLQHDVYEDTARTLAPKAIALLKGKFRLVTVGTCLGVPEENWYRS
ncbi:chitin deacetylase [Mortierella alpina]|uniref:Chitin deacetylase n=1 Tax=Mortierella alpina TaxID=64518 RepID=A0A9P6M218_MORAP|nr:chitin deacetylase [Mortierella alpina]